MTLLPACIPPPPSLQPHHLWTVKEERFMMVAEGRRIGLGLWSLGGSLCLRCWQICFKMWGLYSCFVHSFGLLLPVLSTHKNSCLTYYYFQDFQVILICHMLASTLMSLPNLTVTLGGRNCHHYHPVIEEESPAQRVHRLFFFLVDYPGL